MDFKIHDEAPEELEKYDLCLVFPVDKETNKLYDIGSDVLERIAAVVGAKYMYSFYASNTSKVFVLIRAGLKLLKSRALKEGTRFLLDSTTTRAKALEGDDEHRIDPIIIPHATDISRFDPFDHIYAEYNDAEELQDLYYRPDGMSHPFRKSVRIKMLIDLLEDNANANGDWYELSLEYLRKGHVINSYFAIHELDNLETLAQNWFPLPRCCCYCCGACCCCQMLYTVVGTVPWHQPYHDIRDYLGEKLAFYFLFLGFWSFWMVIPLVVGVAIQIVAFALSDYSRHELSAFSFLLCLWGLTVTRQWQRVEQITAMKWDMTHISMKQALKDRVRFQFYGIRVNSPIDGRRISVYFRSSRRVGLYLISALFMVVFTLLTLAAVAGVFYARQIVVRANSTSWAVEYDQWVTAAMMSVQIAVCNRILYTVAQRLSSWENHRTDEDYDYALTVKVFILQFISTFSSFYYLAFAAKHVPENNRVSRAVEGCGPGSCFNSVAVHLLVVVSMQGVFFVLFDYIIPSIYTICCTCCGRDIASYDSPLTFDAVSESGESSVAGSDKYKNQQNQRQSKYAASQQRKQERQKKQELSQQQELQRNAAIMAVAGNTDTPQRLKSSRRSITAEHRTFKAVSTNTAAAAVVDSAGETDIERGDAEEDSSVSTMTTNTMKKAKNNNVNTTATTATTAAAGSGTNKRLKENSVGEAEKTSSDLRSKGEKKPSINAKKKKGKKQSSAVGEDEDPEYFADEDDIEAQPSTAAAAAEPAGTIDGDDGGDGTVESGHDRGHDAGDDDHDNDDYNDDVDDADEDSSSFTLYGEIPPPPQLSHEDDFSLFFTRKTRFDQNHRLRRCYSRICLLLGVMLCFGATAPGIFLIGFLIIAIEIRFRAWQFVYLFERPRPWEVENVGNWEKVMEVLVLIAIGTNAALVVFTMDSFRHWEMVYKVCLLIGIVVAAYMYKLFLAMYIRNLPPEVLIQKQRAEFLAQKLIKRIPDREPEQFVAVDML